MRYNELDLSSSEFGPTSPIPTRASRLKPHDYFLPAHICSKNPLFSISSR